MVLQGEQNAGKTRFFENLLPQQFFKRGLDLDPKNKDSVMKVTKNAISELGELDSTTKKDQSLLKAFIDNTSDDYRAPYERRSENHPRRTLLVGTVNPSTFLNDDTGSRRFVVVPVEAVKTIDFDPKLLWASVIEQSKTCERVYLNKEEVKILNCYNQEYNLKSDTDLVIGEYIEKPQGKGDRGVATSVMITEYLNSITKQNLKPGAVGKSLKKLGFEQDEAVTRHSGSKPGRYWYIKAIKDVTIPF